MAKSRPVDEEISWPSSAANRYGAGKRRWLKLLIPNWRKPAVKRININAFTVTILVLTASKPNLTPRPSQDFLKLGNFHGLRNDGIQRKAKQLEGKISYLIPPRLKMVMTQVKQESLARAWRPPYCYLSPNPAPYLAAHSSFIALGILRLGFLFLSHFFFFPPVSFKRGSRSYHTGSNRAPPLATKYTRPLPARLRFESNVQSPIVSCLCRLLLNIFHVSYRDEMY